MTSITDGESVSVTGYIYTDAGTKPVLVEVLGSDQDGYLKVKAYAGAVIEHPHYGRTDTAWFPKTAFHPMYSLLSERPAPAAPAPEPRRLTLLDLARAAAKDQWYVGEIVRIWGTPAHGAYLQNVDQDVRLYITGVKKGLSVFWINWEHNGQWHEVPDLDNRYRDWMQQVKQPQPQGQEVRA